MNDISGHRLRHYYRGAEGAKIVYELNDEKQVDIHIQILGHPFDLLIVLGQPRNIDKFHGILKYPPKRSGYEIGVKSHGCLCLFLILYHHLFEAFLGLSVQINFVNF